MGGDPLSQRVRVFSRRGLYIKYLERCKPQIGAIFAVLGDGAPGMVVHCHAGKDRTGIIAALVLSLMGVSEADIGTDYSLSREQITHLIAEWRQYALEHGRDMTRFNRKVASTPETMTEMFLYIREHYGDTAGYLRACGIPERTLSALKTALMG